MGTTRSGSTWPAGVMSAWPGWGGPPWRPDWSWALQHECLGGEAALRAFPEERPAQSPRDTGVFVKMGEV